MTQKPNETTIKNYVRVLYKPIAGKTKTRRCLIDDNNMVSINGGKHTVSHDAMFTYKGKLPYAIVQQGRVAAISLSGEADILGPQFLNEAVSNHYASECLEGLEEFGKKQTTQVILIVLVSVSMLLSVIFGIWSLAKIGSLQDALTTLQAAVHTATTTAAHGGQDATVVTHA